MFYCLSSGCALVVDNDSTAPEREQDRVRALNSSAAADVTVAVAIDAHRYRSLCVRPSPSPSSVYLRMSQQHSLITPAGQRSLISYRCEEAGGSLALSLPVALPRFLSVCTATVI